MSVQPYEPAQVFNNLRAIILPALHGDYNERCGAAEVVRNILARGIAEPASAQPPPKDARPTASPDEVSVGRPAVTTSHDGVASARRSLRVAELDLLNAASDATNDGEKLLAVLLFDLVEPVTAAGARLEYVAGLIGEEAK